MRQMALGLWVALGLSAYAGEGSLLVPRMHDPGERGLPKELTISESLFKSWDLTQTDQDDIKGKLAKLNEERKPLLKQFDDAQKELLEARKKVNDTLGKLEQQEAALHNLLSERLGADKMKDFAILYRLQPTVDWLVLTDDQVKKIVEKQRLLLASDPRPAIFAAARAGRQGILPETKEERSKQIARLTDYAKFNKDWLDNIRSELLPDQQKVWDERYRRTQFTLPGGK